VQKTLSTELEKQGYLVRFAPAEVVKELQGEIVSRVEKGEVDNGLYANHMSWFDFDPWNTMENARSLMIVALPDNALRVEYQWKGKHRSLMIPPIYFCRRIMEDLFESVDRTLSPHGYSAKEASLPEKLLATKAGLAKYGRNNITYVPGTGSYHRLVALYTDIPCEEFAWGEPEMLEICEKCRRCAENCPAQCIDEERFLISSERCLTFFNENRNPFPEWVKREWHNAIVGCIRCQTVCPANPKLVVDKSDIVFSEDEVREIIEQIPKQDLSISTRDKLQELCLLGYYPFIGRNLQALLSRF